MKIFEDFELPSDLPFDVLVSGTADGAGKELNALAKELGVPNDVCKGHRCNTVAMWALGINGTSYFVSYRGL